MKIWGRKKKLSQKNLDRKKIMDKKKLWIRLFQIVGLIFSNQLLSLFTKFQYVEIQVVSLCINLGVPTITTATATSFNTAFALVTRLTIADILDQFQMQYCSFLFLFFLFCPNYLFIWFRVILIQLICMINLASQCLLVL